LPACSASLCGMALPWKKITIIGVGLLGGSLGLAIKACDPRARIVGVGRRPQSLDQALKVGAVDAASLDAAQAVRDAQLVVLATPVGAFEDHLRAIRDALPPGAIVTDVGSTKAVVVRTATRVLTRRQSDGVAFVGSHPMAGSELRGPTNARADLFAGATCIITPTLRTSKPAVDTVDSFWQGLGMRTVRMTPADHDKAVARISHLPHALAALLMGLPTDAELEVSATGFRDATRLASGDAEMWRDIFATNSKEILAALKAFDRRMTHFRDLIEAGNLDGIERVLNQARDRRSQTILKEEGCRL